MTKMNTEFKQWCERQTIKGLTSGELCYPRYKVVTSWKQESDKFSGKVVPISCEWDELSKEEKDPGDIIADITNNWFPKRIESKKLQNVSDFIVKVEELNKEVWCLSWFSHWTFDIGMTDEQVLDSFSRYVKRVKCANEHFRYSIDSKNGSQYRNDYFCLMGAEDRYRWRGCETAEPRTDTDPPCRCEYCKKHGVVRIDHWV
jgi:hypothetical protein